MHTDLINTIYRPVFFKKGPLADQHSNAFFQNESQQVVTLDLYESQAKELIKVRHPTLRLTSEQIGEKYREQFPQHNPENEGIWVYYPWSNRLLHILDEPEFIELRTARNRHKITDAEQQNLAERKIGIIGLSVGHAVAMTLATERSFGSLRLADFDILELSNLNRIRTGLHQIGLNKCIITAREIAEIDPFLDIRCFPEGITSDNLEEFLCGDGKLDLLIDECDDLEIKIKSRQAARSYRIPVIMETSDRGLLDVERFDLEPGRPILHGILANVPEEKLTNIAPADRLGLVMQIIDVANTSVRGRASLLEVGQTISTWPQLASAVTLGGGVVADVSRRLLLGSFTDSGRYYVDLEQLVGNKPKAGTHTKTTSNSEFQIAEAIRVTAPAMQPAVTASPDEQIIRKIVTAASLAPSWGNVQPWKWLYRQGALHLFSDITGIDGGSHDIDLIHYLALGAAYRNAQLKSAELGYESEITLFPSGKDSRLVATIRFSEIDISPNDGGLADFIASRATNRHPGFEYQLTATDQAFLLGGDAGGVHVGLLAQSEQITEIARIAAECDLTFMLSEEGQQTFFGEHIRWEDGHRGHTLQQYVFDPSQFLILSLLREPKVAALLREVGGGNILNTQIRRAVSASSGIAWVSASADAEGFFKAGTAAQDIWLRAEKLGLAAQPLLSPVLLFDRLKTGKGLTEKETIKLTTLRSNLADLLQTPPTLQPAFLLRIHKTSTKATNTERLPLDEILFIENREF